MKCFGFVLEAETLLEILYCWPSSSRCTDHIVLFHPSEFQLFTTFRKKWYTVEDPGNLVARLCLSSVKKGAGV